MKLKIKALTSEARASGWIVGALPFFIAFAMTFVAPTHIQKLFTDPRGMAIIGAALTLQAIGALVMAKMVKFDI
jgi:tight adherence protein B